MNELPSCPEEPKGKTAYFWSTELTRSTMAMARVMVLFSLRKQTDGKHIKNAKRHPQVEAKGKDGWKKRR